MNYYTDRLLPLSSFVFICLFVCSGLFAEINGQVLYIASYHPDFPTFSQQTSGIKDAFSDNNIRLDIEFMDTKRFPDKQNWQNFTTLLSYKLSHVSSYDAIIIADDNALLYALEHQNTLFAQIPIVFLGVNNISRAKEQNNNPQITGVVEAISMNETIDLMIRQNQNIKTITVIVDGTTSGQGDLKTFYNLQDRYKNYGFDEINLSTLSWKEFKTRLRSVKKKSSVLLLSAYLDKSGETHLFEESIEIIVQNLSVPFYHLWQHGIGDGALGGKVISHYNQGKTAGNIVERILSGEHIEDIPVIENSPNQFVFDYLQLQKHGIPAKLVPEKSTIINIPYSFYDEHKRVIWGIIATITTLTLALIFAIFNILKRHRIEKELRLSKARFKFLTTNLRSVVIYQLAMYPDGERKFLYISENVKEINGVSPDAVLADVNIMYSQILEEYRDLVTSKENEALATMDTMETEAEILLPNGEKRWFQFTSTPNKYPDGTVIWNGAEIDITDRKRGAKELRELRNYLSNIIDSMPSALICVDTNAKVTQWNRTVTEITGLLINDVKGKNISEIYPDLENYIGKIYKSILNNTVYTEQTRLTKNGNRYEDITIYPLISNGVRGAVIRIDDVTKEYNLELELNHSRKMDAIGQLAGGIAHDFNNMLAGILGAAEILKSPEQKLSKENLEYIEMILNAAARSADLTKKLLAFGRKGKLFSTEIDVHDVIDNTLSIISQTIDRKITVSVRKEAGCNFIVGDNSALQNALMNLCINSSHAMSDGGKLTITTKNIYFDKRYCNASMFKLEPGDYIELAVRDTGCGIPIKSLKRIFEPFYTTKAEGVGTGLGLSAVYGTVLDHHGAVTVYSEPNEGTIFHLYFPCSGQKMPSTVLYDEVISGSGLILLVDDEEVIRITGKYLLESMGYSVLLAEDGREGLTIFEKLHNDIKLVIMDMIMPNMNGRETFLEMKKIDDNCRVILSSGFTEDENLDEMRNEGLKGFLTKPFTRSELAKVLSSSLVD